MAAFRATSVGGADETVIGTRIQIITRCDTVVRQAWVARLIIGDDTITTTRRTIRIITNSASGWTTIVIGDTHKNFSMAARDITCPGGANH